MNSIVGRMKKTMMVRVLLTALFTIHYSLLLPRWVNTVTTLPSVAVPAIP